eukprot:COSAG02_NODE_1363_length_13047_cov_5.747374_5_plen_175_part_00
MEVSAFMTEQLKEQLQLQRDHDDKVRVEMEAKLTAQKAEMEAKLTAQMTEMETKLVAQTAEARAEKQALEAQLDQHRQVIDSLRTAARPQLASEVIQEEQLASLQTRLQTMHEAKLITSEELHEIEDALIDCIEVMPTAGASAPEVDKVAKILLVAAKVPSDSTLARQLRRKFL